MKWLLAPEKITELQAAYAAGFDREAVSAFIERERAAEIDAERPRNMTVAGDNAQINVVGVLTPDFDLFAYLFGGGNTTYAQIQSAFAAAATDPNVRRVTLFVNSPGGTVDGLFETLAVIEAFPKPIAVRASEAASAAYAIAATAGPITATTPAASFGSVGVVASFFVDEGLVDITSTQAPNKRPDVSTPEGQAVVREYLDALHGIFVDAIARGRTKFSGSRVNVSTVNSDFGRGSMFIAADAQARGMIDKIPPTRKARADNEIEPAAEAPAPEAVEIETSPEHTAEGDNPTATSGQEKTVMDLKELKAQHPDLYAAVLEEGVQVERDRVCSHLTMGEKCGALDIAVKAVRSGEGLTMTLQAEYLTANVSKVEKQAKQDDSDAAADALDNAKAAEDKDLGDLVWERFADMRGIETAEAK